MSKKRILVVDDEQNIRETLKLILEYEGYEVLEAGDPQNALNLLLEDPQVVLLDVKLPHMDGLQVLQEIKRRKPWIEVIMISGHGTIATAIEATKLGAFDFLEKPIERDRVLLSIRNALERNILRQENILLKKKAERKYELIGNSPPMKKLREEIERVAPTDATVLIMGESGTGKELIARMIHKLSHRANEPFVQVNCAAIPEELIESELFGHEKGAFTGATEKKIGKFELAHKGTIFLDEIGDMSFKTQAKVLRVLEEGEVQRVGSTKIIKVDVRIIAATNKDLAKEIKEGRFREDLYFRLSVVPIYSPPLREKKEDIPLLIDYFMETFAEENNYRKKRFTDEAMSALIKYPWKGNVRELRNLIERLIIMVDKDVIEYEDLPDYIRSDTISILPDIRKIKTLREFKEEAEKLFILVKLKENKWNISRTAEEIDTPRSNLYKKLESYGIKYKGGAGDGSADSDEESEESPNSTGQDAG